MMTAKQVMEFKLTQDGKEFVIYEEAIREIFNHPEVRNRKIVVVSIIGEYRKGKSFFLGYCLRFMYANYPSTLKPKSLKISDWLGKDDEELLGFKWRHGSSADTKGILIWPDVFLHDSTEKLAIIFMDTQGLFELESTEQENAKIFGLSTLLSSVQIVNLQGVIQENQIRHLEMATSLTKIIAGKKIYAKNSRKPFQKLLFLIRDWGHEDFSLGYEGGKKYLENFLSGATEDSQTGLR